MASKTFLLLALAFAVVLLIASEVAANDLASNPESTEVDDHGHGGGYYNGGGRGGRYNGGGRGGYNGGGRGGYNGGGRGGHGKGGGGGGCKYGCCGGRYSKGCRCCSTFEEATAYKQTQN